jgi:hypothetical protein
VVQYGASAASSGSSDGTPPPNGAPPVVAHSAHAHAHTGGNVQKLALRLRNGVVLQQTTAVAEEGRGDADAALVVPIERLVRVALRLCALPRASSSLSPARVLTSAMIVVLRNAIERSTAPSSSTSSALALLSKYNEAISSTQRIARGIDKVTTGRRRASQAIVRRAAGLREDDALAHTRQFVVVEVLGIGLEALQRTRLLAERLVRHAKANMQARGMRSGEERQLQYAVDALRVALSLLLCYGAELGVGRADAAASMTLSLCGDDRGGGDSLRSGSGSGRGNAAFVERTLANFTLFAPAASAGATAASAGATAARGKGACFLFQMDDSLATLSANGKGHSLSAAAEFDVTSAPVSLCAMQLLREALDLGAKRYGFCPLELGIEAASATPQVEPDRSVVFAIAPAPVWGRIVHSGAFLVDVLADMGMRYDNRPLYAVADDVRAKVELARCARASSTLGSRIHQIFDLANIRVTKLFGKAIEERRAAASTSSIVGGDLDLLGAVAASSRDEVCVPAVLRRVWSTVAYVLLGLGLLAPEQVAALDAGALHHSHTARSNYVSAFADLRALFGQPFDALVAAVDRASLVPGRAAAARRATDGALSVTARTAARASASESRQIALDPVSIASAQRRVHEVGVLACRRAEESDAVAQLVCPWRGLQHCAPLRSGALLEHACLKERIGAASVRLAAAAATATAASSAGGSSRGTTNAIKTKKKGGGADNVKRNSNKRRRRRRYGDDDDDDGEQQQQQSSSSAEAEQPAEVSASAAESDSDAADGVEELF